MRIKSTSKFNLIWLLSYISIASLSAVIITPAIPAIEVHFEVNSVAVEWVITAFLIGYMFGQLIYGPLANKFGRLKALRIGLTINLLGIIICLLALAIDIYYLFMFGRFITALGAASGLACTFMLINEWLPGALRKTAMSYSVLSFAFGVGIAVILGGIITEYWYWQGCFWVLLLHGLIMLCGTCVFSETLVTPQAINPLTIIRNYTAALSSLTLVIFSLVVGCCSAISYCFSSAGPQISHDSLKLSAAQYGYWNGLNVVGMLMGGLLAKQLLINLSIYNVIAIGFFGIALGIINLLIMWNTESQSILLFFLTTAWLYLFSGLLFAGGSLGASNAIADKASAAAMMSFVNMCFSTICVMLMGYLDTNPYLGFIIILSVIWLLVVGLLCMQKRSLYVT